MSVMNTFLNDVFDRIATEAGILARKNNASTINTRDIQTAVRLVLPVDLCRNAMKQGTIAMEIYARSCSK